MTEESMPNCPGADEKNFKCISSVGFLLVLQECLNNIKKFEKVFQEYFLGFQGASNLPSLAPIFLSSLISDLPFSFLPYLPALSWAIASGRLVPYPGEVFFTSPFRHPHLRGSSSIDIAREKFGSSIDIAPSSTVRITGFRFLFWADSTSK